MPSIFDSKYFNAEVFGKYLETIPRVKQNAFLTAGIFRNRTDLKAMLSAQTGGNYITIPMVGRIGGAPVNYDGDTDITTTGIGTYAQSMVVVGRAKGWEEKDFSFDITGHDFMRDIAAQVSEYWDDYDQYTLLNTLKGVYAGGSAFATNNTYDISGAASSADQYVGPATLNNAIQKAAQANKNIFTLAIMHSVVATNLENLELLEYRKYTDANGIQRNLNIADWNGRTVLVDDDVPVDTTYTSGGVYTVTIGGTPAEGDKITVLGETVTLDSTSAASTTAAATAVVTALGTLDDYTVNRSTATITFTEKSGHYGAGVPTASVSQGSGSTVTVATTTEPVSTSLYTTYILGRNAITYCDCGAKVPYETTRDAITDGGVDKLITRQRKLFAPFGFSYYLGAGIVSPTDEQLVSGSNWGLVRDTAGLATIDTKAIPIARIISKG
jgi:hypothetical protein